MGYLDDLYDRVSDIPMPNNRTVLKSAYHIASIAYDLRVALWIAYKDEESIVTMVNILGMVRYKLGRLRHYSFILASHPEKHKHEASILNDSLTYLQDVLEVLKIEYSPYINTLSTI